MPIRVVSNKDHQSADSTLLYGLPKPPAAHVQLPAGVSLCMIVKNEERFLEQALRSVAGVVDEINIVDTGSTDRTVEIAKSFGANVEYREWRDDFGWARNESLAMATKRWIFVLDADEELDPECQIMLRALKNVPAHTTGCYIRCYNLQTEGEIDPLRPLMAHSLPRFFPNSPGIKYINAIHEYVATAHDAIPLPCQNTPLRIWHHGYVQTIIDERGKIQRNLNIIEGDQKDLEHPFHWYNLGQTKLVQGEYDDGIEALEKMWEINGNTPRGFLPIGLTTLADALSVRKGNHERGVAIMDELITLTPNYANAHFVRGQILIRDGKTEEGRDSLMAAIACGEHNDRQMVVDSEISDWKAHNEIGVSYVAEANIEKALEWFDAGHAKRGDQWQLRLNRARAMEALKRFSEAEEEFRAVHELLGNDGSAVEYVDYLLRRKRFARALETIRACAGKVSPQMGVQLLIAGAAVTEQTGIGGAELYLQRALAISPGSGMTYSALEALAKSRGTDSAISLFMQNELQTSCITAEDFVRRSHVYLDRKEWPQALDAAEQGLRVSPYSSILLINAALALVQLERRDEALTLLSRIDHSHTEVYATATYLRAVIVGQAGDASAALGFLDELLSVEPGNADGLLLQAELRESSGDIAGAEISLLAARDGAGARVATQLAAYYLRHGRFSEAVSVADAALALA